MKLFKATGESNFSVEEIISESKEGMVKIKITNVMPSKTDLDIFQGKLNIDYPIVPCHMAIGVVSDDNNKYELKRGTKVVLNPYITGDEKKGKYLETKCYGIHENGFLRDYISLPIENIIPFPEGIKESEAIFTEYISIALATINNFKIEKGDYIAIIGASTLCNIISQLALYFQAIPIVIDGNAKRLTKAKECGVYYTIDTTKESPMERVLEITGGRMAEHTILENNEENVARYLFSLAKQGGDCNIVSANKYERNLDTNINLINNKQLTVKGVYSGENEFDSAINILAQRIIDVNTLVDKNITADEIENLFKDMVLNGEDFSNIISI